MSHRVGTAILPQDLADLEHDARGIDAGLGLLLVARALVDPAIRQSQAMNPLGGALQPGQSARMVVEWFGGTEDYSPVAKKEIEVN